MRLYTHYLVIIALFAISTSLNAQFIDKNKVDIELLEKLEKNPTTPQKMMLVLTDQVDIAGLSKTMETQQLSKHERRVRIVQTLEQKAAATQADLLKILAQMKGIEDASIFPYWLVNAIELTADYESLKKISEWESIASIESIKPIELFDYEEVETVSPPSPNGSEPGLRAINADELWRLGYTGYGTKVFVMDSGQDEDHPSIKDKFWGNNVPISQAWSGAQLPEDCGVFHGSHVLGIVNGLDRVTNDTIGVAPDARWLGGPLLLDDCTLAQNIRSSFNNFQWALNPDGNSNTTDDIPDVINNSWGRAGGCNTFLRDALNTLEAADVAVVWAAGNEGPDARTMSSQASINTSLVNSFAVGSINSLNDNISVFSSRGPSGCSGSGALLIKPEVVAPGDNVRSLGTKGNYISRGGTSFASPHVSGALLLLREAFPNVSALDLKLSLYRTARDLGAEGEDNTFGNGLIDVFAAYNFLIDQGNTPTPPSSAENDAILVDVRTKKTTFCKGETDIQIIFENNGNTNLQSLQIDYFITGAASRVDRLEWQGSLAHDETIILDFPAITDLPAGQYELVVDIFSPNGRADSRKLNNRMKHSFQVVDLEIVDADLAADFTTVCRDAEVVLESESALADNQIIRWYDSIDGDDVVAEGQKAISPILTENTTFYADIITQSRLGKSGIEEDERTSYAVDDAGLAFTAYQGFLLKSVFVTAEKSGGRIIKLVDDSGELIKQKVITIRPGESRLELNFVVPSAGRYELLLTAGKSLLHSNTKVEYPYTVENVAEITGSASPYTDFRYFFFYDWEIESNHVCGRTPLTVEVNSNSTASPATFNISTDSVFLDQSGAVTFTNTSTNASQLSWDFGDGNTSTASNPTHIYTTPGNYKVILTIENSNGCLSSTEAIIVVRASLMTSTNAVLEDYGIVIYPNPTADIINIEQEGTEVIDIQVVDMLGRRIQAINNTLARRNTTIDLSNLPNGIYYIWLKVEGKQLVEKVVKN